MDANLARLREAQAHIGAGRLDQAAALLDAVRREAAIFTAQLASAEAREAMQAVLEKRKPDFSKF